MRIIKSTNKKKRKYDFGDFEIIPDEGWIISQMYKDYESGLFIVEISDKDEAHWEDLGYGSRRIPTKQFIVSLKTLEILHPDKWKNYFNYNKIIYITDDNKFKLMTQRIHEPENNTDSIYEELYFLKEGQKYISTSVAFREDKRENLLEEYLRRLKETEQAKIEYERKPDLEQYHLQHLNQLKKNEKILFYHDNKNAYFLTYLNPNFELKISGVIGKKFNPNALIFSKYKTFETIEEFLVYFLTRNWYKQKKCIDKQEYSGYKILTKGITNNLNSIRKSHSFTLSDYYSINSWQNLFWTEEIKETEYKQFCPICFTEIRYCPRYPKYICENCDTDNKLDFKGNKVSFTNIGFAGGLRVLTYDSNGRIIQEDDSHSMYEFRIGDNILTAEECRFGGVVIQLKK